MSANKPDRDPADTPEKRDIKLTPGSDQHKEESVEQSKPKSKAGHNPNKAPSKPAQSAGSEKTMKSESPQSGFAETQQFLKDTWSEFRKISWPERKQVLKETWSVLVLVTVITLAVLAFDYAIGKAIFEPLDKYAKKVTSPIHQTVPIAPTPAPAPAPTQPEPAPSQPQPQTPPAQPNNQTPPGPQ